MKIAQAHGDWKETSQERAESVFYAQKQVGEPHYVHEYKQDEVDSWVVYVASEPLTDEQLTKLWECGDLWGWDVVSGVRFDSCLYRLLELNREFCAD